MENDARVKVGEGEHADMHLRQTRPQFSVDAARVERAPAQETLRRHFIEQVYVAERGIAAIAARAACRVQWPGRARRSSSGRRCVIVVLSMSLHVGIQRREVELLGCQLEIGLERCRHDGSGDLEAALAVERPVKFEPNRLARIA